MKKIVFLILFSLAFSNRGMACDSCNFFEYSLLENKSYAGLFYRFRGFNGYDHLSNNYSFDLSKLPLQLSIEPVPDQILKANHEPEGNGLFVQKSKNDFETYQTIEARVNYTLSNNWNFTALLPYEFNLVYYHKLLDLPKPTKDTTITVQGWGDLTLATEYIHLIYNSNHRHTIRPGLALTLPSGQALVNSSNKTPFDPIIQPGKGGFSFTPKVNYQLFFKKEGIQLGVNYQWNTEGEQAYKFGKSFNLSTFYFRQITIGENFLLVPNIGFYLEQSEKDTYKQVTQELTGGTIGFGQFGIDFNHNKTTLSLLFQRPVFQHLNGNQIFHQNRISLGIIRSFKL